MHRVIYRPVMATILDLVLESMSTRTGTKIKVSGKMVIDMVREHSHGLMAVNMSGKIKVISGMVKGPLHFLMGESM
jgi:hypothetical protein